MWPQTSRLPQRRAQTTARRTSPTTTATCAPGAVASSSRPSTAACARSTATRRTPRAAGTLCARGQAGVSFLYDPDRLKQPMIRSGERGSGAMRTASWTRGARLRCRQAEQDQRHLRAGIGRFLWPHLRRLLVHRLSCRRPGARPTLPSHRCRSAPAHARRRHSSPMAAASATTSRWTGTRRAASC